MSAIVNAARTYLGVPFVHQGRSRRGVDCVGLLVCVAQDLGIPVSDDLAYGLNPDPVHLRVKLSENLAPIAIADAQPGDVYQMRFDQDATHVAIVTDRGIIHALSTARGVVEHRMDNLWRTRIRAAWRVK